MRQDGAAWRTATFKRKMESFRGDARLYLLSEPMGYDRDYETDELRKTTDYVIVSAVNVPISGPETYIFPADVDGKVLDWMELPGSFRGARDHERALIDAGYAVVGG